MKGDGDAAVAFIKSKGWTERAEGAYGPTGRRRYRRRGFVINYYCPKCTEKGVTAAQVAERSRTGKSP